MGLRPACAVLDILGAAYAQTRIRSLNFLGADKKMTAEDKILHEEREVCVNPRFCAEITQHQENNSL